MEKLNLKKGKVISLDDPDKLGRIQIKVIPELDEVPDNDCPWAEPFITKNDSSNKTMKKDNIVVDSIVRLLVNNDWTDYYYLGCYNIKGFYNFDTISSLLDNISEISYDYKSLEFYLMENGNLQFNDNTEGNYGFFHNSGSYSIFDKDGNIISYSVGETKLYDDNNTILINSDGINVEDGNGNNIVMGSSGMSLEDKNGNTIDMGLSSVKINGSNCEILQ